MLDWSETQVRRTVKYLESHTVSSVVERPIFTQVFYLVMSMYWTLKMFYGGGFCFS